MTVEGRRLWAIDVELTRGHKIAYRDPSSKTSVTRNGMKKAQVNPQGLTHQTVTPKADNLQADSDKVGDA